MQELIFWSLLNGMDPALHRITEYFLIQCIIIQFDANKG